MYICYSLFSYVKSIDNFHVFLFSLFPFWWDLSSHIFIILVINPSHVPIYNQSFIWSPFPSQFLHDHVFFDPFLWHKLDKYFWTISQVCQNTLILNIQVLKKLHKLHELLYLIFDFFSHLSYWPYSIYWPPIYRPFTYVGIIWVIFESWNHPIPSRHASSGTMSNFNDYRKSLRKFQCWPH